MTINELREKRNTAWENTKDFLETHRMENGLISAADAKTYEKMVQDIQSYGEEIARLEQLQSMEDILREGQDESGGYLVPDEYDHRLVEALEQENIFRKLATTINTPACTRLMWQL